jgi:hypothetical protein
MLPIIRIAVVICVTLFYIVEVPHRIRAIRKTIARHMKRLQRYRYFSLLVRPIEFTCGVTIILAPAIYYGSDVAILCYDVLIGAVTA